MKTIKILIVVSISIIFSSCRTVGIFFEQEEPDIIPYKNEEPLYRDIKSVLIRSGNQTVVYSSDQISSSINVVIAEIEKGFLSGGYDVVKDEVKADVVIEVLSIDQSEYNTNTVRKSNGKSRKYTNCNFERLGLKAFVKVSRRDKVVHYTFYLTPCVNGCWGKIDRDCNINYFTSDKSNDIPSYSSQAKYNPVSSQILGRYVYIKLIERIKKYNKNK